MRDILNKLDKILVITEADGRYENSDVDGLKAALAHKIMDMPNDPGTEKALKEIEDLLQHVHAGGKMGMINGELARIDDPSVNSAHKMLARYLLSIPMDPKDRDELFELWRSDKLVNRSVLIKKGRSNFSEIITNYNTNPAIKEFVNEVMRIAALGQGKGEFGLSVLSRSINKQEGKGDLIIDGRNIEVKTTDGGAGRFTDQEVRPAAGFESAARELDQWVRENVEIATPRSGISVAIAVSVIDFIDTNYTGPEVKTMKREFLTLLERVIMLIFGGSRANRSDVNEIIDNISERKIGRARNSYAKASFNYYMGMKKDEGVLYINLTSEPINTVYFRTADDLMSFGLTFHGGTEYITSVKDHRLPYPQVTIVDVKPEGAASISKSKKSAVPKPSTLPSAFGTGRVAIRPPGVADTIAVAQPKGVGRSMRGK